MSKINLEEMLGMSKALYEKNKDHWSPMTPEHGKTFILYMIEEIGEVIAILKKKGERQIMEDPQVRERFVEEMADVMMYFTDVLNRFDVTVEEFSTAYQKKFFYNLTRDYKKDHAES